MEKQKNIPSLRFPEFNGTWEFTTLEDVAKIIDCKHITPQYIEFGIPVISPGTIKWGNIDLESPTKRVSEDDYKSLMNHCIPKYGDLVFSRNQSIGIACFLLKSEKFVLGQDTVLIQPNNNQSLFTYFLIQTQQVQTSIIKQSGGSTFARINLKDIRNLKVKVTFSIPEQTKIATFLTSIDDRLNQLKKKKTLLEEYKKGLMQKIFDQEIRFKDDNGNQYPDWKIKNLGEISTIATGSSNREDSSLEGEYTFFDRSQDIRSSSIFLFDGEAIIVAGEGQEFIPKYFIGKFDLHQRTYSIMNFINANGKFLFYQIDKFRYYFFSQAVGSTVKSLRLPMFEKMPIQLPSVAEQTKIANFLSAIDEKINGCTDQIRKTDQYKKGLLQKMFC